MSAVIDAYRDEFGVEPICRALEVAPSTYYEVKRRQRDPSARALRDSELTQRIRKVHTENFGVYGVRKMWWQLRREGVDVARCTVERLMKKAGLRGAIRGRKRRTTIPDGLAERARDLVDRNFKAAAPNRLWVSDFTHVAMWSGVAYVCFAIDAFSRRIVGWKADTTMKTSLVLDTLEMALWARDHHGEPIQEGLILHSDAGSQYTQRLVDAGADPFDRIDRRWLRQRPRRDDDRPLQDGADQPPGSVEDDRPGRARDPGMGRLVQPPTAALSVQRTPSRGVRADEGETDHSIETASRILGAVQRRDRSACRRVQALSLGWSRRGPQAAVGAGNPVMRQSRTRG
jgi:putative transposase